MAYIRFDENGILCDEVGSLAWPQITAVVAYKQDLFTVDLICLELQRADARSVVLHEEMIGWTALVEALPEHLKGCRPWSEWYPEVAFPAFETNETCLWRKDRC